MYETDFKLIEKARRMLSRRQASKATRQQLDESLDKYLVSCRLSRGPDGDRSLHWFGVAADRAIDLGKIVERAIRASLEE